MKPWARYEVGFINHDKFRAITANAICLWLEGKNYADAKLTDGLLPEYEVKLWRFHSKKSVAILTRSCGLKPGTDTLYQPLWDVVEGFGFKMHDYLEHNPSREDALARIDDADAAKVAANEVTRDRMTRWRALKKAKRDAPVTPSVTPRVTSPERNTERNERNGYALLQNTEDRRQKTEQERAPVSRSQTPIIGRNPHLQHAACDETLSRCVPDVIHRKFADALAPKHGGDREAAKAELQGWYPSVWATLPATFVMGEAFRFWQARFDAAFASPSSVGPSGDDAMWAAIAKKGPSVRP